MGVGINAGGVVKCECESGGGDVIVGRGKCGWGATRTERPWILIDYNGFPRQK